MKLVAANAEPRRGRPNMPAGYGITSDEASFLPWSWATERLAGSRNYWIVTASSRERPHAAPVWGLWLDEAFYFSSDPESRKGRNLAASPEAVVHLESGDEVVILEGAIERLGPGAEADRFTEAYDAKYHYRPDPSNAMFGCYKLHLRAANGWREKDYPQSATRWTFDNEPG